jgi:hypothetical protein
MWFRREAGRRKKEKDNAEALRFAEKRRKER